MTPRFTIRLTSPPISDVRIRDQLPPGFTPIATPFSPCLAQQSDKQAGALINRINTPERYRSWLYGLGLDDVRVDIRKHTVEIDDVTAWALVHGSAFRAMLEGLDPPQIVEVQRRYLTILTQRDVTTIDATTLVGERKGSPMTPSAPPV